MIFEDIDMNDFMGLISGVMKFWMNKYWLESYYKGEYWENPWGEKLTKKNLNKNHPESPSSQLKPWKLIKNMNPSHINNIKKVLTDAINQI